MNILWILIIFLFSAFKSFELKADTLLIPEPKVSYSTYQEACTKNSYICTDKYFLDFYIQKETPQFDNLVNLIDLTEKPYLLKFSKEIKAVLQNEMLSEEQLEMTLKLLAQVKELTSNKSQLLLIETELKQIKNLLSKSTLASTAESFVILFKKKINLADYKNFKSTLLKFPVVFLKYNSVPHEYNTRLHLNENLEPLITGRCETAALNPGLNLPSWQALPADSCTLTESFSAVSKSVTTTVSQNKNWLIAGAVILGAALLLNHYEIQFQF